MLEGLLVLGVNCQASAAQSTG